MEVILRIIAVVVLLQLVAQLCTLGALWALFKQHDGSVLQKLSRIIFEVKRLGACIKYGSDESIQYNDAEGK